MEVVVQLLRQTYAPDGEGITGRIQQAEFMLMNYGCGPDFCHLLAAIMESPECDRHLRVSASICLTKLIVRHWHADLPPESKATILSDCPTILLHTTAEIYKPIMNFTIQLVRYALEAGEWPDLLDFIATAFQSPILEEFTVALMFAKALSYRFMRVADDMLANYETVCNVILPALASFISNSNSIFHMTICYQIARRLSIGALPSVFDENPDLLHIFFRQSLLISEPIEDDSLRDFQRSAVKFCSLYFHSHVRTVPDDVAIAILNSVISLTRPEIHPKVLGRCVQFLKHAMRTPATWDSISGDLANFTLLVFLPLFALTPSDLQEAETDPCLFVHNFHSKGTDTSDPRSFLFHCVLCLQAHDSPELHAAFVHVLRSFLAQDSPEFDRTKYSVCHLFSSVARYCPGELCFEFLPLLQSPSFIVRAGGLLGMQRLPVPAEIFAAVVPFLEDESLLVQYYAAHCFASILGRLSPADADGLREQCGAMLGPVIRAFFRLLEEFHDPQFIDLFDVFVKFFGPALFECALDFTIESYAIWQRIAPPRSGMVLTGLATFVGMMGGFPELAAAVVEALLVRIVETIASLPAGEVGPALELVANLVALSPGITELHWRVLECFAPVVAECPDELWVAFRNLIIRDPATAAASVAPLFEMAAAAIQAQADPGEARGPLSFLSALVMAVKGAGGFDAAAMIQAALAIAMAAFAFHVTMPHASALIAAVLVCDAPVALEIIGEQRAEVLSMWLEHAKFQAVLAVLVTSPGAFGGPDLFELLTRAVQLLQEELEEYEKSLFDEDIERLSRTMDNTKALQVFDDSKLLGDFARLLLEMTEHNAAMFEELQERFTRSIPEILTGLQNHITGPR
jgi:hypothetical protein